MVTITSTYRRLLLVGLFLFALLPGFGQSVQAASFWYVTPVGAGDHAGTDWANAFSSIQAALDRAQPGDTIYVGPGEYYEDLVTKTHGALGQPILLVGPPTAVLRGTGKNSRIFQIFHDYYVLDGWTINGYDGSGNTKGDYRDKLLYVHGQRAPYNGATQRGPLGLEVKNMTFLNAGGECIRLRYFVREAHIHHNTIRNCGVYDFVFRDGGKNGEGIYIGTSSEQWRDGKNPTDDPDGSDRNHIHDNLIDTEGNECVEVKEGGTGNLIENNQCTGGKDPESAGFGARGDGNIFRYNVSYGHLGGGIRFGGHQINGHTYGINNSAYGNSLYNNQAGGIKFESRVQAQICGNTFIGPNGEVQPSPVFGSYGATYATQVSTPCVGNPTATTSPTSLPPTFTPTTIPATATALATPTSTPLPPTSTPLPPMPTSTPTLIPTGDDMATLPGLFLLSSASNGVANRIAFRDEDIMAFDTASQRWFLYFDGSDVGIKGDLDDFAWTPDGSLLFTLEEATDLPGIGRVDDSDVIQFTPTALGATTTGRFAFYFDGSDVGLTNDSEDVDGLALLPDGRLAVSTRGDFAVDGLKGHDEDLIVFTHTTLGEATTGTWMLYMDGSDLATPPMGKDLWGVWIGATGELYLSTESRSSGAQDDSIDLFSCIPAALGADTLCPLQLFWDGYAHGFGDEDERIDGLDFAPTNTLIASLIAAQGDGTSAEVGDTITDMALADQALEDYDEETLQHIYLPLIEQ